MSALRDYPPAPQDPATVIVRPPSRIRLVVAVLLLTAMGLLAAASVLASRPYQPAPNPRIATPASAPSHASGPDRC